MTGPDAPEWPRPQWAPRWHTVLLEHATGDTPAAAALRAVLTLHTPEKAWKDLRSHEHNCPGDDFSGYDGERPDWPCGTINAAAGSLGLHMTARCPTCTPAPAGLDMAPGVTPVWPDGRLVTHIAYRLGRGVTCPSSLTVGLTPGQLGP